MLTICTNMKRKDLRFQSSRHGSHSEVVLVIGLAATRTEHEYMNKPGRRGILSEYHTMDVGSGYPDREVRRFMFPKGDVIFIASVDFPYGDDRSGINSDWQRILWNFQFDEDGPLYEGQGDEGGGE